MRHQFCQLVDLPIGHLQHPPDVAQHPACLQRTEGNDLSHLIAAIALLHIADHLVAAVLAEVDIEVRHRHAFRIEKPLEQKAKPDRIEIGDRQRVGDERSRAGATARTDRNACGLRPLNEIRDDQEIARIVHAGDDIELEGEPGAIVLLRGAARKAVDFEPVAQAFLGLAAQFRGLIVCGVRGIGAGANREARQDRLARDRAERAALGDLDGGCQRLRHVGEQHRHFRPRLETVIRGQLLAIGLCDKTSAGDAEQRVMGFVIVRGREIRLIGRDNRKPFRIGEVDQHSLSAAFLLDAVALQLDIEPVAEQARKPVAACRREGCMIGVERERDRAVRAAGQGNQVLGVALEPFEFDVRGLMDRRFEKCPRIEPHQAAVAAPARGKQHDP